MLNFSSFRLSTAVVRFLLGFLLLALRLSAAAQAPAWQSARAVAVAAGTTTFSNVRATAVDAAGNVFLVGEFSQGVVFGGTTLNSLGGADVFVAKFSLISNQFVWAQRAGGTADDIAGGLAVSGNSVYLAGAFFSPTADFGSTTLTNANPNMSSEDVFVVKLTDAGSTGSFAWAQRAGGMGRDYANALTVSGNSVYVAGFFASPTVSFGTTTLTNANPTTITNLNGEDVFVAKLTDAGSTGSFAWAQRAGGTGREGAYALAVSGRSVYVAGSFNSSTASFGTTVLTNAGFINVFVAKLTDGGTASNFEWAQQAGGTGWDDAFALALSGNSVYVAGNFRSSTATFGTIALTNPMGGRNPLGFLASLTDATLTAATAATGPREPATVYPNPARHAATLRLPVGTAPAPFVLTDALGRPVRRYPAPAGSEAALDLGGLPAGLYLLRGAGPAQRLVVE